MKTRSEAKAEKTTEVATVQSNEVATEANFAAGFGKKPGPTTEEIEAAANAASASGSMGLPIFSLAWSGDTISCCKNPFENEISKKKAESFGGGLTGVIMGARYSVTAWEGFPLSPAEKDAKKEEPNPNPIWSAAISMADAESRKLIEEACKAVHYSSADDKRRLFGDNVLGFAAAVKPTMSFLVYCMELKRFIELNCHSNVKSFADTNGAYVPFINVSKPLDIGILTTVSKVSGWDVKTSNISFELNKNDTEIKECMEGLANAMSNMKKETRDTLGIWSDCEDCPITDEIKANLKKIADAKPKKES